MPYFTRSEKEFYANEKGQACFRMVVDCHEGSKLHEAVVCWDFALGTLTLDGEIPEPEFFSEVFRDAMGDRELAFFALFAAGVYAPDVEVESVDDARIAWAAAARAYLLELDAEKTNKELEGLFGDWDDEVVEKEEVKEEDSAREITVAVQWVKRNEDGREGLLLAQFPPDDALKDVWVPEGETWTAATVRGSHTIPVHIGLDPGHWAWGKALTWIKDWSAKHGDKTFLVSLLSDGKTCLIVRDLIDTSLGVGFDF